VRVINDNVEVVRAGDALGLLPGTVVVIAQVPPSRDSKVACTTGIGGAVRVLHDGRAEERRPARRKWQGGNQTGDHGQPPHPNLGAVAGGSSIVAVTS